MRGHWWIDVISVRFCAALAAFGLAFVAVPSASAQSNSLLGNNTPRGVPAAQPADGAAEVLLPIAPAPLVGGGVNDDALPQNEVLLLASMWAVAPPKPRKLLVHDLLTIIVREEKRSSSDSDLKREKKWKIQAELQKWIRLNKQDHLIPQLFADGNPAIDLNYNDKYEGKGGTERKDTLITRVTAEIIDIKPNGLLVLQATKDIRVDNDRQQVTLTGTCRTEDVTPQNTVLSTQLADAKIDIQHTGPSRDAARRGWLARAWDFIRPL